jgi:hypothetical protein
LQKQSKKTKKMPNRKTKGYGDRDYVVKKIQKPKWKKQLRPENLNELKFDLPNYEDFVKRAVWKGLVEKILIINKKSNDTNMSDKEYDLEFEKILKARFKLFPEYKTEFKTLLGSKSEGTGFYRKVKPLILPDLAPKEGGSKELSRASFWREASRRLIILNKEFNTTNMSEKIYKVEAKKIVGDFYSTLKEDQIL